MGKKETEMDAEQRVAEARRLIEEYSTINFTAGELGLGPEEIEFWQGQLWAQLYTVLDARRACGICGDWLPDCQCFRDQAVAVVG